MREQFIDLSVAILGRAPSPAQLAAWEGSTPESVSAALVATEEAQARFAAADNESFLVNAYQMLFGRLPDTAGLNYWLNDLAEGNITQENAIAALLAGARAESGNPNDATLADARSAAASEYLARVEAGEEEYTEEGAAAAVSAVSRESVADSALEPAPEDLYDPQAGDEDDEDDTTPPPGDEDDGGSTGPGNGTPTQPSDPDPEPTFQVAELSEYDPSTGSFAATFTVADLNGAVEGDSIALVIGDQTYSFVADAQDAFDATAPTVMGGDGNADANLSFTIDKATGDITVTNSAETFQIDSYTTDVAARAGETEETVDTAVEASGNEEEVAPFEATFTVADLNGAVEGDSIALVIGGQTYSFVADAQDAFDATAPTVMGGDGNADANLSFTIDKATGDITVTNSAETFQIDSYTTDVAARAGETEIEVTDVVEAQGDEQLWSATFDIAHLDEGESYDFTLTLTEILGDDAVEGDEPATYDLSFTVEKFVDNGSVLDALQAEVSQQTAPFEVDLNQDDQLVLTANNEGINYEIDPIGVAVTQVDEVA